MDRISNVPPGIIELIVCLLPTQEVVRTSILSKEWSYAYISHGIDSFTIIDLFECLPVIESLSIPFGIFEKQNDGLSILVLLKKNSSKLEKIKIDNVGLDEDDSSMEDELFTEDNLQSFKSPVLKKVRMGIYWLFNADEELQIYQMLLRSPRASLVDGANDFGPHMSFDIPASTRSPGCSGPNMSFYMPASPEYLSSLARASLAKFVMSELSNDAIGVYHRIFNFYGVRIPFSSFLLALIKHYKTLCKQGDWFSFAKRRAPSPVCIDDNHYCMKHWKSGFFLIDQRAIPDYMTWRHPDSAIDDPKPVVGSYRMADVRCLSAHVAKLRDMPEEVLALFGLSRVWKSRTFIGIHDFLCFLEWTSVEVQKEPHHDIRPTLQRLPFYCTHVATIDVAVPDPTPEELAVSNPSAKVIAKDEASQKRKASTSGFASSHVSKRTRSAAAQSSGSTTHPNFFADDSVAESDDDDACYEIPIVTSIRPTAMIPPSGNHSGGTTAPAAKGPNILGSRGKGIMTDVDDADVAPSVGASCPRVSSGPAPSFRELFGDAIHRDFFPLSPGPYYATYPEGGIARNCEFTREEWDAPHQHTLKVLTKEVFKDPSVCKTVVDQFLTPWEMVWIKALSSDQLTAKMSVLHYLMMSHGGELLAQYRGLLQSHHEHVQSTDSRLKGYQEKFASLTGLESQVSTLQRQINGLNDKLSASDASFAKSKSKGKERKKKIKSLTKSLDNLHAEVARLSADLNRATVALVWKFLASDEFSRVQAELLSLAASAGFERGLSMHWTKEEFVVVLNKISQFVPGAQDRLAEASPWYACVSTPIAKESTVTLASTSLELLSNTVTTSSTAALEPNEEWGVSHVVDDVTELTVAGSECASFGLGDVVVTLFAGEKGDGYVPSSTIGEVVAPLSVA
ncbi:integrase, catalytic region, zinc finger, CCHC-type containing protein [Tanacetum coccineum]